MKGHKIVTNLVPYGPEKPRSGMVKQAGTNQVEIFWDPPKGDFTKYYLYIDRLSDKDAPRPESILRLNSARSTRSQSSAGDFLEVATDLSRPSVRVMENISSKLTTYTILGLEPGESYKIELGTKTGNVPTRQSITDIILTRPVAPRNVRVEDVTSNTCVLAWAVLQGHSSLRGFMIHVKTSDGKMFKDVSVTRNSKNFVIQGLGPGLDYDISLTSLCVADDGKRTESDPAAISTTTLPEKIRNLRLDNATANSLTNKWDAPVVSANYKYKVTIRGKTGNEDEEGNDEQDSLEWRFDQQVDPATEALELARPKMAEFVSTIEVPGDKTQYTLAKLPEIAGTGYAYSIEVCVVVVTPRENEVSSSPVSGIFVTKPLAPTNFRLDKERPRGILFHKSMTPYVQRYKVKWRPLDEGDGNAEEVEAYVSATPVQDGTDSMISFVFPPTLQVDAVYKVNVHAVVEVANQTVESKELHEKLVLKADDDLAVYTEEPKDS